jgi:hypothetical protein
MSADHDNRIFDIPAYNLEALTEEVTRMNRRATKLGCQPLVLRVVREYELEKKSRTGAKYMQARMEVELLGETPKFNGWSLFAAVEMQDNGENLVRCVPGKTVPEAYRATDTHCDHCKSTRRRKEVFILGHDDGRFVQVGRQCIADFLGHVSADNLASRAEWEFSAMDTCKDASDDDFCYGGGRGEWRRDITEYLVTVAIVVRRLGWVSRSMLEKRGDFEGVTTASTAWSILVDWKNKYVQEMVAKNEIYAEERDETLAKEALEWARSQPTTGVDDYLYNLGVACRQSYVNHKNIGIVASAIAAYQRHLDKEAELNIRRRQNLERKHVGEVGKRSDFENVVVKRMRYFESEFGVKTLVTFEDQSGNVLIWWASKQLDEVEEGETVNIRGTVKKHGDYQGMPQTELQRVKIEKIAVTAAENA